MTAFDSVGDKQQSKPEIMELNGSKWIIGVTATKFDTRSGKLTLASASSNGEVFVLYPTLITQDGVVEKSQIKFIDKYNNLENLKNRILPSAVEEKLLSLANEKKLYGRAGDYSIRSDHSTPRHLSHSIEVNGQRADVGEWQLGESATAYLELKGDMPKHYILYPTELNYDGKTISRAELHQIDHRSGKHVKVRDDVIAPRLLEELTNFSNRRHLFGIAQNEYNNRVDSLIKGMDSVDMDAEIAKLTASYYADQLHPSKPDTEKDPKLEKYGVDDTALLARKRDWEHAASVLKKTDGHHERDAFERRYGWGKYASGDLANLPSLRFDKDGRADVLVIRTPARENWNIVIQETDAGKFVAPQRNVFAERNGEKIAFNTTLVGDHNRIDEFKLFKGRGTNYAEIDSADVAPELLDALRNTAQNYGCYGLAGFHTLEPRERARNEEIVPSHRLTINGATWEFSTFNPADKDAENQRPYAMAQRVDGTGKQHTGDAVFLDVSDVADGGKIPEEEFSVKPYVRQDSRRSVNHKVPHRVEQELKRFAETFQLFGTAQGDFEKNAQADADPILKRTDIESALNGIQLSAHEDALRVNITRYRKTPDETTKDDVAKEAAAVKSHKKVEKALAGGKHTRRELERREMDAVKANGDADRFKL